MKARFFIGIIVLFFAALFAAFFNPTPGVFDIFDAWAMAGATLGLGLMIGSV